MYMKIRVILLLLPLLSVSQNPLDQSRLALKNAQNVTDSIKAYQDIAWYSQTSSIDSSFFYNKKAQKLIDRTGDKDASNTNLKELAGYVYRSGDYKRALSLYKKSKEVYLALNDSLNVAKINSNLGAVYQSASRPKKAMEHYIMALRFFETDDKYIPVTASTLTNLGVLYKSMGNTSKALESYQKAEKILANTNDKIGQANLKANLGGLYVNLKEFDKAKKTLEEARELALETGNYTTLAAVDQNLGTILMEEKNYDDALVLFEESLSIKTQLGDMNEAATSMVSIANIKLDQDKYEAAVSQFRQAITIFEKNNNQERLLIAYPSLNAAYIYLNEQDSAFVYLDKYTALREKMYREDAVKISTELDKKYQSEKKDRELAEQRTEILEREIEVKDRNTLLWILGLVLLAAILLGTLLYRQQQLKNRQLKQENELKEAKVKIQTQNKLQEQRLRISRDLHDNIGSQLTFLISSLDNLKYAKNISAEVANEKMESLSSFTRSTIGELRDTIWAMNKDRISLQDLNERLISYTSQAQNTGIEINIDPVPGHLDEASFNAVNGMHVFRIIQEAINNAIKYSGSKVIDVNLQRTDNELKVAVRDNGNGFHTEHINEGNGLRNMKERAAHLGGSLDIKSSRETGTVISLKTEIK
jgi:signal transduction histidine kinase